VYKKFNKMYVTSNVTFHLLALVYELAPCYKILPHLKFRTVFNSLLILLLSNRSEKLTF
jgi:hypothetical protein